MVVVIYKYALPFSLTEVIEMPEGARVISVHEQYGLVTLWMLVDPAQPPAPRAFRVVATDEELALDDDERAEPIGSVHVAAGALVYHVLELVPAEA